MGECLLKKSVQCLVAEGSPLLSSTNRISMKRIILLLVLGILVMTSVFGQDQQKYSELVKEAWGLYESKNYQESAEKYSEAFKALGDKGLQMIDTTQRVLGPWQKKMIHHLYNYFELQKKEIIQTIHI